MPEDEVMDLYTIDITANEADQRLDRFLRKYLSDVPLSDIYKMLRKKVIRVNGRKAAENYRLSEGDVVEVYLEPRVKSKIDIRKSDREFSIIYEDDNILAVDKPAELILHPDARHKENTLVDQVLYYLYESGDYDPGNETTFRPAAVNRLDVNTGGIVLFAKNYRSLQDLNEMIREHQIDKYYLCVVKGKMSEKMEIKAYLTKDYKNNIVSISEKNTGAGKEIHTIINPLESTEKYSLVEINLITGRSHQIRAQLAHIGRPIVGDIKYGDAEINRYFKNTYRLHNQFLHAYRIYFNETPANLKYLKELSFKSKLPPSYCAIIKDLFQYSVEGC